MGKNIDRTILASQSSRLIETKQSKYIATALHGVEPALSNTFIVENASNIYFFFNLRKEVSRNGIVTAPTIRVSIMYRDSYVACREHFMKIWHDASCERSNHSTSHCHANHV